MSTASNNHFHERTCKMVNLMNDLARKLNEDTGDLSKDMYNGGLTVDTEGKLSVETDWVALWEDSMHITTVSSGMIDIQRQYTGQHSELDVAFNELKSSFLANLNTKAEYLKERVEASNAIVRAVANGTFSGNVTSPAEGSTAASSAASSSASRKWEYASGTEGTLKRIQTVLNTLQAQAQIRAKQA